MLLAHGARQRAGLPRLRPGTGGARSLLALEFGAGLAVNLSAFGKAKSASVNTLACARQGCTRVCLVFHREAAPR